jgi:hypothetical protein
MKFIDENNFYKIENYIWNQVDDQIYQLSTVEGCLVPDSIV